MVCYAVLPPHFESTIYDLSFGVLVFPCLSSYDLTLVAFALECVLIGSNSIFYIVFGYFRLLYYCTVMTLPRPLTGNTLLPFLACEAALRPSAECA